MPTALPRVEANMKRRRHEQAIQRAVFGHLAVHAATATFAFHPGNGGARSPIEAKILKGQGVTPGVPDVIAIKGGQIFGLELKAPGGRLSPAQIECHELVARKAAPAEQSQQRNPQPAAGPEQSREKQPNKAAPAKPQRLGLADLRAAWLARQRKLAAAE
jgi:hypothetical protein